jgi:SAM-dependent methyltransferase
MTTLTPDQHRHEHEHQHQHDSFDWAAQLARLELGEELHLPFFDQAVTWLHQLRGDGRVDRILDIGSGAGVVSVVLARTFPEAAVVAVDGTPALLDAVTARAQRLSVAERVQVHLANLPQDGAQLPQADLIWASDAVHHFGDQQAAVDLLHGRLRSGGLLAVIEGGLPARFLPNEIGFGRSGLQARLDAATADGFAEMRAALHNATAQVDDWPGMLRASGFETVESRSFLVDVPAPLSSDARAFLRTNLAAQRDWIDAHLDAGDREAITRLLDDDDPRGLLRRTDVFYLTAKTVHVGRAPA